jgi:hypothetical protein
MTEVNHHATPANAAYFTKLTGTDAYDKAAARARHSPPGTTTASSSSGHRAV